TPSTPSSSGTDLVGVLEGPVTLTDVSTFPTSFGEAPQLAAMVAAGKLPPVEERLPSAEGLLVIQSVDAVRGENGIGEYGGIWRRGFTGPADKWNGYRCCSGPDHVLFWDFTGSVPQPNIAKGWEFNSDGRELTLFLREGMRWSDGDPFDADDFMFWFDVLYQNEELVPNKTPWFAINGKQGTMSKIDDYTLKITFPDPYFFFADVLAGATALGGHAYQGLRGMGFFAPKHYLEQFVPEIAGQDVVDKLASDEGYDNWVNLFKFKNDWALNPEVPVVTPWQTVTPINTPTWKLERNPYYFAVDTEGNQLPYIDTVILSLAEDLEVINLRAIAGEFDWQARHLNMAKVPVYIENQEKGDYTLYFDTQEVGSDVALKFNMDFTLDPEVGKWLASADFRRAVSMGIERDQLNEVFWLGLGVPGSHSPAASNLYAPEPESEWRDKWSTFDPELANQMLDDLGLDKRDSDGFRLRTDNGERLVMEISGRTAQFMEFVQIAEMVAEQWGNNLGLKTNAIGVERSLEGEREVSGEIQISSAWGDGSDHLFTFPGHVFTSNAFGYQLQLWRITNGEKGTEPQQPFKDVIAKYVKAFGVPADERIKLGKELWEIVIDQAWIVGLVGQSPASLGVRVVKNDLGNIPARQYNNPDTKTPSISRPVTWYWKSAENRQPQPLSYE
ncbi:MAG TPA: ABC transporter substrate-binding protein, partial [SAR202 cluster bacterium]|nr:ABC transporter substrate-binding protein [SAR202 cluster bacterium]